MTLTEARDAVQSRLFKGIDATLNKFTWVWPDIAEDTLKDKARVVVSFDSFEGTHSLGEKGFRFFQREETLRVMVKFPIKTTSSIRPSELAEAIKNLFEGEHLDNGVWFKTCLVKPLGTVESDIVYAVMCDYSYQEQK